ncbi:adenylate/guanylate cyclase domain-containing protein [Acuticoccus sp.]|uniref:adenylate/guanylate cyclase domain-containing protein n=1 Tax=Acuticoccus sp. TaxID=1904378 RepID=UPI003B51DDD4
MAHGALIGELEEFLAIGALEDMPVEVMLAGFCERARAGGLPVARVSVAWRLLDPIYYSQQTAWRLGHGISVDRFRHGVGGANEAYLRSPLRHALDLDLDVFRRRIGEPAERDDFGVLEDLAAAGLTDYVLCLVGFGERRDGLVAKAPGAGLMVSFATDAPPGFADGEVAALLRLRYMLALAARTAMLRAAGEQLVSTYLARSAGRRVLQGTMVRGDGELIDAVIWYADLRRSTELCEALGAQPYIALLNAFFAATAGPVADAGGDVLDFIGDAVLAIFPMNEDGFARGRTATVAALAALEDFRDAHAAALGGPRTLADVAGIAIDIGTVVYGNIGIPERLTFSVIGSAVNKVARIERMTKALGEVVLVTNAIASSNPRMFADRGTHALDGLAAPQRLYALRTDLLAEVASGAPAYVGGP